jgi:hypothetical protein
MMRKKLNLFLAISCLFLILSLTACNLLGRVETGLSAEEISQTAVAVTMVIEESVQTIVAATLAASSGSPELQPVASPLTESTLTATLEPTITLTPTPENPMVRVNVNTNCRKGPGLQYEIVGNLQVGDQAEVVGVSENWEYWVIKNPQRQGECWLWGYYASVVGSTSELPMLTPPPTPTPTFTPTLAYNWTGTWTTSHGVTGTMHETYIVSLVQTGMIVSGSFSQGAFVVTLSGTLSADGSTLTGVWSDPPNTGPFVFKIISMNQFIGNRNSGFYEWCGSRSGASLPSPCMGP